jgi:hypothetical protein
MTITYYDDLEQGTDAWAAARCGLLTASEMKLIVTPTLKIASNDKERAHLYELLAQRVTGYVEPHFIGEDMERGKSDEIEARIIYAENYGEVRDTGFVTNDEWGFTIGYSPDGLVGEDGLIECKSRRQKFQAQTIIDGAVPDEHRLQLQTGLLVTGRAWIDYVSYCGGMPMITIREFPDASVQEAIVAAAAAFERRLAEKMEHYAAACAGWPRMVQTERKILQEMFI